MGGFAMRPTGEQTLNQREVDSMIQEMRMAPKKTPPPLLGIRQIRMMREKNNGYPKHLYHPTLDARLVLSEEEEQALLNVGYREQYEFKAYPKYLHRRNMDAKFEPQFDKATTALVNEPFVETRLVKSEQEERMLHAMKPKKGQSAWMEDVAALPPIEDGPEEDPAVTIARLQGQIAALQQEPAEVKRGPGRPRKTEEITEA